VHMLCHLQDWTLTSGCKVQGYFPEPEILRLEQLPHALPCGTGGHRSLGHTPVSHHLHF
jgi:hypothetical protein